MDEEDGIGLEKVIIERTSRDFEPGEAESVQEALGRRMEGYLLQPNAGVEDGPLIVMERDVSPPLDELQQHFRDLHRLEDAGIEVSPKPFYAEGADLRLYLVAFDSDRDGAPDKSESGEVNTLPVVVSWETGEPKVVGFVVSS